MIYVIVLFGSFFLLSAYLGAQVLLRHRAIRMFVRGMSKRADSAKQRGFHLPEDSPVVRQERNPRVTALETQKLYQLSRAAEKALAQQKLEEAESLYIQALTIRPDYVKSQADLAKLYLLTNREAKAEALYREVVRNEPDAAYFGNLGLAYYKQGKYEEACQSYQESLNRDPANPDRSAALGRACMAAGRFVEAAPLLEKGVKKPNRSIETMHLLAECYLQLGDREQAEETYRRINKIQPYDESVKAKLHSLKRG